MIISGRGRSVLPEKYKESSAVVVVVVVTLRTAPEVPTSSSIGLKIIVNPERPGQKVHTVCPSSYPFI